MICGVLLHPCVICPKNRYTSMFSRSSSWLWLVLVVFSAMPWKWSSRNPLTTEKMRSDNSKTAKWEQYERDGDRYYLQYRTVELVMSASMYYRRLLWIRRSYNKNQIEDRTNAIWNSPEYLHDYVLGYQGWTKNIQEAIVSCTMASGSAGYPLLSMVFVTLPRCKVRKSSANHQVICGVFSE